MRMPAYMEYDPDIIIDNEWPDLPEPLDPYDYENNIYAEEDPWGDNYA